MEKRFIDRVLVCKKSNETLMLHPTEVWMGALDEKKVQEGL